MPRFSTHIDNVSIVVKADGKTRISGDFANRLLEEAQAIATEIGTVPFARGVSDSSNVRFSVGAVSAEALGKFMDEFSKNIETLVEFGPDTDVLNTILAKFPEARNHPRFNELIGTFEMTMAKAREIVADGKSTAAQTTPELSTPAKLGRPLTKEELIRHRDEKLKGQAPDQVQPVTDGTIDPKSIVTPVAPVVGRRPGGQNVFGGD